VLGGPPVTIDAVSANNRSRRFDATAAGRALSLPYTRCEPEPSADDPIVELYVDPELGREGFTYTLASGAEGSVVWDQLLEYNRDPAYMRDILLYLLTSQAQDRVAQSRLSKREIIRRLGTSPAQFYRLLDTTNYRKTIDSVVELLQVLDCDVEFVVREREPGWTTRP
jgi:DNA-binding TFAR19-related protein (PDSD5 family)